MTGFAEGVLTWLSSAFQGPHRPPRAAVNSTFWETLLPAIGDGLTRLCVTWSPANAVLRIEATRGKENERWKATLQLEGLASRLQTSAEEWANTLEEAWDHQGYDVRCEVVQHTHLNGWSLDLAPSFGESYAPFRPYEAEELKRRLLDRRLAPTDLQVRPCRL